MPTLRCGTKMCTCVFFFLDVTTYYNKNHTDCQIAPGRIHYVRFEMIFQNWVPFPVILAISLKVLVYSIPATVGNGYRGSKFSSGVDPLFILRLTIQNTIT